MKNAFHYVLAFFIGLIVLLADLISKYFVHQNLPVMSHYYPWYPYGGIGVFKDFFGIEFSITHATNKGAAWGILAEWQEILLYFRILLIIALLVYVLFYNTRKDWLVPFFLVIAGAIGNVVDYFLYGHVVDMLHFRLWGYNYPVFNIADSAIFIGVSWLLLSSLLTKTMHNERKSSK